MDVRQRTFLLALVGLGLGVLVVIGVAVLFVRGSSESAPIAQRGVKDENVVQPPASAVPESPPPRLDESPSKASERAAPGPLVVHDGAVQRVSCDTACGIESQCGFRDVQACRAASCDGAFRKVNESDFQMGQASDCGVLAVTPCEEACWRRGECAGDHAGDKQCTAACVTLSRQLPQATFRESRCVLESACADLALCGGQIERPLSDAGHPDAGDRD